MKRLFLLLIGCGLLGCVESTAQTTRVRGRVTDAATGEPLPFVSVLFPNTTVGISTDSEGVYALETRDTSSVVLATLVGYRQQSKPIVRRSFNQVDFALEAVDVGIDRVVITPGANPAHPILKGVIRHKPKNDPMALPLYRCATYTKMELDIANIGTEFRNRRLQRDFGFIFNYVDTSALTGQVYLPVMISETLADYYHSRKPEVSREVIRANRVSGIDDTSSIAQFTGSLQSNVNFYDNFIELFDVQFASPLADGGQSFYNYFLVDSMQVDGRKTYKIRFHPKRLTTPVLDGEINIDSATYALQSASARMPKGQNINWIKHLRIENSNQMANDSTWFPRADHFSAEFAVAMNDSSKLVSLIGTREVNYSDVRFGEPIPAEVLAMDNSVVIGDDGSLRRDESYWDEARPYRLTEKEKGIYAMVDSVQQVPLYRNIYTLINTIVGGYYKTKYIEIGPYYKMASFNRLEGFRMQFAARTTKAVSRTVRLGGYVAYGTHDEKVKGGGSVELSFNRRLMRKLTLNGSHDVVQLGAGQNALTDNNIFSSIFSRGGRRRLSMVDRFEAFYEHEWFHGLDNRLGTRIQRIYGNKYVPLVRPDGSVLESINDASLQVGMRITHDEKVMRTTFSRYSLEMNYPVLSLSLTAGMPKWMKDTYEYYRLEGGLHYRLKLPPLGYSDIMIQGGKIFGKVPYPLLKLHEGNATYFYDPYAFSCMNFYEFASDAWVGAFFEYHFDGWLLGRIPLIKKLKLREVFICKGVWGTLSNRNNGSLPETEAYLLFPEGMTSVDKPYVEMGFGVENILRLFRVDCIWRLTHRNSLPGQNVQKFAVNLSLQLKF